MRSLVSLLVLASITIAAPLPHKTAIDTFTTGHPAAKPCIDLESLRMSHSNKYYPLDSFRKAASHAYHIFDLSSLFKSQSHSSVRTVDTPSAPSEPYTRHPHVREIRLGPHKSSSMRHVERAQPRDEIVKLAQRFWGDESPLESVHTSEERSEAVESDSQEAGVDLEKKFWDRRSVPNDNNIAEEDRRRTRQFEDWIARWYD